MRHTLRETWSGLRRNLAMTVAVVVTMAVSLSLFGLGLLTSMEVDLVKGRWYDKIEISVFLCIESTTGGMCEAGKGATDAQRDARELLIGAVSTPSLSGQEAEVAGFLRDWMEARGFAAQCIAFS